MVSELFIARLPPLSNVEVYEAELAVVQRQGPFLQLLKSKCRQLSVASLPTLAIPTLAYMHTVLCVRGGSFYVEVVHTGYPRAGVVVLYRELARSESCLLVSPTTAALHCGPAHSGRPPATLWIMARAGRRVPLCGLLTVGLLVFHTGWLPWQ